MEVDGVAAAGVRAGPRDDARAVGVGHGVVDGDPLVGPAQAVEPGMRHVDVVGVHEHDVAAARRVRHVSCPGISRARGGPVAVLHGPVRDLGVGHEVQHGCMTETARRGSVEQQPRLEHIERMLSTTAGGRSRGPTGRPQDGREPSPTRHGRRTSTGRGLLPHRIVSQILRRWNEVRPRQVGRDHPPSMGLAGGNRSSITTLVARRFSPCFPETLKRDARRPPPTP